MNKINSSAVRAVTVATLFLVLNFASALFANEAAPGAPVMRPAVITGAASKAMMLGSARAGKRIVAVGDHGIVLLSDDHGKSFYQAKSVPVRSTLTEVYFADESNGWAVGHWGVILASTDGGQTWQLQRSDTAVDQPLLSVYFKDKNRGWAVGLWSLILDTRDGGKTWNAGQLPPPPGGGRTDRNLLHIFAGKTGTIFIAAEQGTVLRSADDGATWSYNSTAFKGSFWTGVALREGTLLVGGLRGNIFRSTDDGKSWRQVESGTKSSLTTFVESGGKVYAAGLDGVYLESANGGATFAVKQREDKAPLTSLAAAPSGQVVVFSKFGVLPGLGL